MGPTDAQYELQPWLLGSLLCLLHDSHQRLRVVPVPQGQGGSPRRFSKFYAALQPFAPLSSARTVASCARLLVGIAYDQSGRLL